MKRIDIFSVKALFDMRMGANQVEPGHGVQDNRNKTYGYNNNQNRNTESSFFNMIQDNFQKYEAPEPKKKESLDGNIENKDKQQEEKIVKRNHSKEEDENRNTKTVQYNDLHTVAAKKLKTNAGFQQPSEKHASQDHNTKNLKSGIDKVESNLKNIGSLLAKEVGEKSTSDKVIENTLEKTINLASESKQTGKIKSLAGFIKEVGENAILPGKQQSENRSKLQTYNQNQKFEPAKKETVSIEEIMQKNQTVKNKKAEATRTQTTNNENVSRETPKVTNSVIQENTLSKDQKPIEDLTNKVFTKERVSLSDGLKKSMESDMSSFQGSENGSRSGGDKTSFLSKLDNNPALRSSIQQQVDAILSRARTIVRNNGNASFSTNLYPKELGKISIRLSLIDGKLTGNFTVENETVQKELIQKMDKIVSDMKLDGYEVEKFNVNVNSGEAERKAFAERENKTFHNSLKAKGEIDQNSELLQTEQEKNEGIYA